MEEVYIYNGKEYTKEQIQAFADKAGAPSFDAYISQFGIKKKEDRSSGDVYSYNGKEYSFDEVNQLAIKAGAPSVQDYVNHFGLKKKETGENYFLRSQQTQEPLLANQKNGNAQLNGSASVKKNEPVPVQLPFSGAQITTDFREGYIPQVSRMPGAELPYVKKAKETVLELAKQQVGTYSVPTSPGAPKIEFHEDEVKAVESGDIDAITRVIQNKINLINREKDSLPKFGSKLDKYLGPRMEITEEEKKADAKIKELNDIKNLLISNAMTVVNASVNKQYDESDDKSIAKEIELGEKVRKAAFDMEVKKPDGTIDNYSDQKRQVEFLLKHKLDKTFGLGRVSNTQELSNQYTQEFEYANRASFLGARYQQQTEDVNEYLKNAEVAKFIAPNTTDKQREEMMASSPDVTNFISDYNKLYQTQKQFEGLVKKYPAVERQLKEEQIFQAYGQYVASRRKTIAGEAVQNVADIFSGYQADEESEFKAISEITGIPIEEVRQIIKDNPQAGFIPSQLRKVINSASSIVNGIEQSFYRSALSKPEADIVNRVVGKEIFRTPDAFKLSTSNVSIRSVMDGVANGLGQFLGFAATIEMGSELLAVPKNIGLFSEARLLGGASGVPIAEYSSEAGKIINAMNRAKNAASTFGVGYASSRESAYQEAARYTNNEAQRQAYADGDAFWNGISELLLPDNVLAKKLGKAGTSKVLDALKSGKPLTAAESFMIRLGEGAKVMGLESAEELMPLIYDTVAKDNMFGYRTSSSEFMEQLYNTILTTAISTVPMALGAGLRSPTSTFTKSALYNAGVNDDKIRNIILEKQKAGEISQSEANRQIKMVNTMAVVVKEVEQLAKDKGFENDEERKIEIASLLLRKRVNGSSSESINDAISKRLYKEDDEAADKAILDELNKKKIFTDFDETLWDNRTQSLTPLGEEMKKRIAAGEDVTVLTSRGLNKKDGSIDDNVAAAGEEFIAQQLGLPQHKIISSLTPEQKAQHLLPGSTYYNENDTELEAARTVNGVNVVDVKTKAPQDADKELEDEIKSNDTLSEIEKKEGLQYFVDKAGEDPVQFMERFGKKVTMNLIGRIPTDKLVDNRNYLSQNFGKDNETVQFLSQVLSDREKQIKSLPIELNPNLPLEKQTLQKQSTKVEAPISGVEGGDVGFANPELKPLAQKFGERWGMDIDEKTAEQIKDIIDNNEKEEGLRKLRLLQVRLQNQAASEGGGREAEIEKRKQQITAEFNSKISPIQAEIDKLDEKSDEAKVAELVSKRTELEQQRDDRLAAIEQPQADLAEADQQLYQEVKQSTEKAAKVEPHVTMAAAGRTTTEDSRNQLRDSGVVFDKPILKETRSADEDLHDFAFGQNLSKTQLNEILTGPGYTIRQRGMAAAYLAALRLLNNNPENFIGRLFAKAGAKDGGIRIVYDTRKVEAGANPAISVQNGVVVINAYRLGNLLVNKFGGEKRFTAWLESALQEETIHLAALHVATDEEINQVAAEMTDKQKERVRQLYDSPGAKLTDYQLAQEYLRMIYQEKVFGTTTEMMQPKPAALSAFRDIAQRLLTFIKKAFAGTENPKAQQILRRLDNFVKGKEVWRVGPGGTQRLAASEGNFSKDEKLNTFLNGLNGKAPLQRNPLNPREFIYDNKASLEFSRFNKKDRNEIDLQDIAVFDKSKGIGNSVMNNITDVADELGIKLTLDAKPFGNDEKALNKQELVDFYKKHGFMVDIKNAYGGDFKTEKALMNYVLKYKEESVPMFREPNTPSKEQAAVPPTGLSMGDMGLTKAQQEYNDEVDAYQWYVINTKDKKAISGFEYQSDAKDLLRDFEGESDYKVVSKRSLSSYGIENPNEKWKNKPGQTLTDSEGNTLNLQNEELKKQLPDTLSPEEKQGSLRGGEANAEATILTAAVHSANEAAKKRGEGLSPLKLKQDEAKRLEEFAKEKGIWIDTPFGEPDASGVEQDVYFSEDGKTATKVNPNADPDVSWNDFFHRLAIQNSLFPDVAYTLKGFTEHNGNFSAVLEQPFIIKSEEPVRYSEVKEELGKLGFEPANPDNPSRAAKYTFVNKNTGVELSDLHGENVIKGIDGKLHFIDPIINIIDGRNAQTLAASEGNDDLSDLWDEFIPEGKKKIRVTAEDFQRMSDEAKAAFEKELGDMDQDEQSEVTESYSYGQRAYNPGNDPIKQYKLITTKNESSKHRTEITASNVFGEDMTSDDRFAALVGMLDSGAEMIGLAQQMFGGADVETYGGPLLGYIKDPKNMVNGDPKKAILLGTLLGEIKDKMERSGSRELQPLYVQAFNTWKMLMHETAQNLVAGRLLRLFRDKYMSDIYEDIILEEQEAADLRDLKKAIVGGRLDENGNEIDIIKPEDYESYTKSQQKGKPKEQVDTDRKDAKAKKEKKQAEDSGRKKKPKEAYNEKFSTIEKEIKKIGGEDLFLAELKKKIDEIKDKCK